MAFVLDASVALAWFLAGEATRHTEAVLERLHGSEAAVPVVWPLEVANAFLMAERRQRITPSQTADAVGNLTALPIRVDDGALGEAWGTVLRLARDHGLTAYDASYLELAMRLGLPLATQDARLGAAAGRVGVHLVEPPADEAENS